MNNKRKRDEEKEFRKSIEEWEKYSRRLQVDSKLRNISNRIIEEANTRHFWGYEYGYDEEEEKVIKYHIKIKPHWDNERKRFIKLTKVRIALLYDLLERDGFIGGVYLSEYQKSKYSDKITTKELFMWAFGHAKEPYIIAPIIWNKSKSSLRELLEFFIKPLKKGHLKSIEHIFCDKNGEPIQLNKRKEGEYSKHYMDLQKLTNDILKNQGID